MSLTGKTIDATAGISTALAKELPIDGVPYDVHGLRDAVSAMARTLNEGR